nr:hypothetical protein [Tanacetum cinerariifolium]
PSSLSLYAPFPSASVTSYGPSHLRPSFPSSFAWLASLLWHAKENRVSPLLDLIMVQCAHRTCGISSIQSLLPLSNRTFTFSPKLLFAFSTKPLACGCLTEAKHWWIFSFSHEFLNGLSLNGFLDYVAALGMEIGLSIDKEMHTGLVAGIDHGKAKRGLAEVAPYDSSVEERYVFVVLALRNLDFNFLSQLESWKDACIADIMDSLRLDGPFAEILEVSRLQPAYEKLLLPIHRKEDNAIIRETSLSDSLNVVHDRVQKVKEGALSHRLFISEAMGPLLDPLSSKNLVGKASTSGVPATVAITTVLTASVSSIPPISVADYKVLNTEPQAEASHYPKIIFEQKTLETSPKHPATTVACDLFGAIVCTGLARPLTLRTFQVRERSFPLRSLSLYAPFPSASVTSYGPSYLRPRFPSSFAWLASLLWYTRSPGLKLVLRTLEL